MVRVRVRASVRVRARATVTVRTEHYVSCVMAAVFGYST